MAAPRTPQHPSLCGAADSGIRFIPAWKHRDGNRLVIVAPNHVFETREAARDYQMADFIFYVPMGLTPDGILEIEMLDGHAHFPHVLADIAFGGTAAIIGGPAFDDAMANHND